MSPQLQRERTLAALVEQLAGSAAHRPVLLVWEDVHWADPTSLELLGLAIDRLQSLPVLALVTFRPEFAPPWPGHDPRHLADAQPPEPPIDAADLVAALTGGKPMPAAVLDQIVARADGVPLFVEELTKTVLEVAACSRTRATATSSQARSRRSRSRRRCRIRLLARLDRLAPGQGGRAGRRRDRPGVLPCAAGRGLTDRPEDQLRDALDRLVAAELVFRRGTPPEATYIFKHALVQDAAYGSVAEEQTPAPPRPHRTSAGGAVSRDRGVPARLARTALH